MSSEREVRRMKLYKTKRIMESCRLEYWHFGKRDDTADRMQVPSSQNKMKKNEKQ